MGLPPPPQQQQHADERQRRCASLPNQASGQPEEDSLHAHPLLHCTSSNDLESSTLSLRGRSGSLDLDAAVAAAAAGLPHAWHEGSGGGLQSEISLAKDVDLRGQPSLDAECGCPATAVAAATEGRAEQSSEPSSISFAAPPAEAGSGVQQLAAGLRSVSIPDHGGLQEAAAQQPHAGELTATSICLGRAPAGSAPNQAQQLEEPPHPVHPALLPVVHALDSSRGSFRAAAPRRPAERSCA